MKEEKIAYKNRKIDELKFKKDIKKNINCMQCINSPSLDNNRNKLHLHPHIDDNQIQQIGSSLINNFDSNINYNEDSDM